jgi:two-component system, OmpR family, sensor histidine kinase QseC
MAEADDALRRQALLNTIEGCDRATHLVEQLLTLSRLDVQRAIATPLVDLASIARRVVAELAPRALAKRQVLELDVVAPGHVAGDETLLAVLVRNLVDNALRHSPAAATIRVSLVSEAGRVTLRIDDSGPGLSDADLQRLGERFFRVIGSGEHGSGLGWSIAQRIAAFHQATLRARRSVALGGLSVELTLPAFSAACSTTGSCAGAA